MYHISSESNEYQASSDSNKKFKFYPMPDYTLLYTACTNVSINNALTTRVYTHPGSYSSGTPDPNT